MVKDFRAHRFFIPDDHVEPTKSYLRTQAMRADSLGDKAGAVRLWRDYARVRPIQATSMEISSRMTGAIRNIATERYATYSSFGASMALALGPALFDWANGNLSANVAAYQVMRPLSVIGVGVGTDRLLVRVGQRALRGTVRGNAIVGTAVAIAETAWLFHEHGAKKAFYQPEFYEEVFGGVGALGLGLAGGFFATGAAIETGPWAPVIGFGAGAITGTLGYFGGKTVTRSLIEYIAPEMLLRQEKLKVQGIKDSLDRSIQAIQKL